MEQVLPELLKESSPLLITVVLLIYVIYNMTKRDKPEEKKTSSDNEPTKEESSPRKTDEGISEMVNLLIQHIQEDKQREDKILARLDAQTDNILKINENLAILNGMLEVVRRRVEYLERMQFEYLKPTKFKNGEDSHQN